MEEAWEVMEEGTDIIGTTQKQVFWKKIRSP